MMNDIVAPEHVNLLNDLTFQQEQFVLTFVANGGKAVPAAVEAGYGSPETVAYRVLAYPKIQSAIKALRAQKRVEMDLALQEKHLSPDRLIAELCIIAGFDLGELLTNGRFDPTKLQGEATKAVAGIETSGKGTKIKTHDKLKAIDMLMDHFGLKRTPPAVAVQVNLDFGERMAMRRARALGGRNDGEG